MPRFTIGKRVYLMVDDDAARARERVVAGLHRIYGGMPGIEAVPVSRHTRRCRRGAARGHRRRRRDDPAQPLGDDVAEDREQMERLAAEVLPQLA